MGEDCTDAGVVPREGVRSQAAFKIPKGLRQGHLLRRNERGWGFEKRAKGLAA